MLRVFFCGERGITSWTLVGILSKHKNPKPASRVSFFVLAIYDSKLSTCLKQKTHNKCCGFSFAEKEGFEPPEVWPSTVFKTAAFDHSAISPTAANIGSFFISENAFLACFFECLHLPYDRLPIRFTFTCWRRTLCRIYKHHGRWWFVTYPAITYLFGITISNRKWYQSRGYSGCD